ncbi:uncharacterized protein LOC143560305 isoform X1 [Bidens hawaiensis]|uniref:uncharacterized protein LOC143560305 isoform X1 n=1 Tax=Bidens hawaiensis TaxID=980011 RepID=UPI004048F626
MGRPPSNGGPSFRFTQAEIAEMEAILQAHKIVMPESNVLVSLAEKFSKSEERSGKIEVQMKQVWNWFQNRRYAIRAKAAKEPGKINVTPMARDDSSTVKGVPQVTQPHAASLVNVRSLPQVPQHPTVPSASVRTFPQAPQQPPTFSVQGAGRVMDNSQMEYEAKSARDGAWYDVSTFISHRSLDTGDPEVFVRFAGFGAEEDEWVNVKKNVRQRSLPCEASECVAVLPADLILCFQEGKEQALYFDAHVLDAQRRRHDVRGCRCRFLVRYDHDQSEEIVALRKICRRPETDYRLQQLHAVNESIAANQNKNGANNNNNHTVSTLRVYPPAEVQPKQPKVESVAPSLPPETPQKRQRLDPTVPPEGSQIESKVEPVTANAPQNQQTAPTTVSATSDQTSLEPEKLQPAVRVPSAHADEVPVELQKVQPLMPDSITEEHNKAEQVSTGEVTEAVGPVTQPSAEPVVSGSSVEVPAELHVQPDVSDQPHTSALETKSEEPMLVSLVNEPDVVEEAMEAKANPVVTVSSTDANVFQEAKTEEHVVPVESNVSQDTTEATTEQPVVPVEPNVAQEAIDTKTEEHVVLVSSNDTNMVQEAKPEEPVVHVDSNVTQEATTEEPAVLVDSNVVQEAKTEEPVVPVDSNVAQEATTEEPLVHVDYNSIIQEALTELVDPNVAQWATTEELMMLVDSYVIQEARFEEPVDSNVAQQAKTEEPVPANNPIVAEADNEDKHANAAENVGDDKGGTLDLTPENDAVAMEEG